MKKEIARNLAVAVLSVHAWGRCRARPLMATICPPRRFSSLAPEVGVRSKTGSKLQGVVWLSPTLDIAAVRASAADVLESARYELESESPMEMIQKHVEDLKRLPEKVLPPKRSPASLSSRDALSFTSHTTRRMGARRDIKTITRRQQDVS